MTTLAFTVFDQNRQSCDLDSALLTPLIYILFFIVYQGYLFVTCMVEAPKGQTMLFYGHCVPII